jgi:hypothetical protein
MQARRWDNGLGDGHAYCYDGFDGGVVSERVGADCGRAAEVRGVRCGDDQADAGGGDRAVLQDGGDASLDGDQLHAEVFDWAGLRSESEND